MTGIKIRQIYRTFDHYTLGFTEGNTVFEAGLGS